MPLETADITETACTVWNYTPLMGSLHLAASKVSLGPLLGIARHRCFAAGPTVLSPGASTFMERIEVTASSREKALEHSDSLSELSAELWNLNN